MRIEDEIQQKAFASAYEKVHVNLAFTSSWMSNRSKQVFKPYGITMQQYNVLRILRGKYPDACCAGTVKEVMVDKSPDLTRLMDRLVEKELVSREICPSNRRKIDIRITEVGLKLLDSMQDTVKVMTQASNVLTEEEANHLSDLLDKLRSN